MKNTKLLTVLLGTSLIFSACGANNQNQTTEPAPAEVQEETVDTTDEPTDDANNADDVDDLNETDDVATTEPKEEDTELNTMPQVALSLDDALKAYYDHFGDDTIDIIEVSLDLDDGAYQYEIEGFKDGVEYDADVDANTGDVVEIEVDDDEDSDTPIDFANIIKPEEAIEAALAGQEGAYVEEWSLEVDDGRTVYELDIQDGDDKEVDAVTGEVIDD